ncbi:hypothetical protein M432DRAFT_353647 [Thermoascus aurantiacus ATCC 26904]
MTTWESSASLEILPPEIQCHILKQIPDITTLHALLRASPRYFQVYRVFQAVVLSHVTRNQITPALLPLALDALEWRRCRESPRDCAAVLAFLQNFRQKTPSQPRKLSLEISKELLRFHNNVVEFFISDFARNRLAVVDNYLHSRIPSESLTTSACETCAPILSHTEHFRLARAFYYLELYGNLCYHTPPWDDDNIPYLEQLRFFDRLREWELEEFMCVQHYMFEKLSDYLNRVEDDCMQDFLEDEPYVIEPFGPNSRWEREDIFFSDLSQGRSQESWLEGCLTRGLRRLKTMLTADTFEARLDAFGPIHLPDTTLTHVLWQLPPYDYRYRASQDKLQPFDPNAEYRDDSEKPSSGWSWATEAIRLPEDSMKYPSSKVLNGMRRWGYGIWDHWRLQSLGIFTKK